VEAPAAAELRELREAAQGLVRQLTPAQIAQIRKVSRELLMEISQPISAGHWHLTYVRCKYIHYYAITPVEFPVAVLENPSEVKIRLHGTEVWVKIRDIEGVRKGWLPHIFEPDPIPVFLITSSPWMNMQGITAAEVTSKFTSQDLEDLAEGVEAYQTRLIGSLTVDIARDRKAWMDIAGRRARTSYDQALRTLLLLFMYEAVWGEEEGKVGGLPWLYTQRHWVGQHKKGVAIGVGVIILILVVAGVLGFFMLRLGALGGVP
jgi:hypothetical protein